MVSVGRFEVPGWSEEREDVIAAPFHGLLE
jgi:hypothetical protein